ncbi:ATP-grasp domain-containing protein, partial [Candidatus Uhrbacteria bacterium]|nr:ATP-grasp domain-containing protein [Candidatus Uhrbacteria bacterium]
MGKKEWRTGRDTFLYVSNLPEGAVESIKKYGEKYGRDLKVAVIHDIKSPYSGVLAKKRGASVIIKADFRSVSDVQKALLPHQDKFLAVTARGDSAVTLFREAIPHLPELRTPNSESLIWSVNKIEMRKRFFAHDKTITPKFAIAKDSTQKTIDRIVKSVNFPCVVKPPDLAESILVAICFHEEELQAAIKRTFTKVRSIYKKKMILTPPRVLVEQFMEGNMYSIDAYVDSRGTAQLTPMVYIKTGRSIGFDDFFGYQQMTPTNLKTQSIKDAHVVARKAIKALGLRSTSAHIELMRTEDGWKVIEVGARIGGFRVEMYELSYGFDHGLNDILHRVPNKINVPKRKKGYTAAMKFFAKEEGELVRLVGPKKALKL